MQARGTLLNISDKWGEARNLEKTQVPVTKNGASSINRYEPCQARTAICYEIRNSPPTSIRQLGLLHGWAFAKTAAVSSGLVIGRLGLITQTYAQTAVTAS